MRSNRKSLVALLLLLLFGAAVSRMTRRRGIEQNVSAVFSKSQIFGSRLGVERSKDLVVRATPLHKGTSGHWPKLSESCPKLPDLWPNTIAHEVDNLAQYE